MDFSLNLKLVLIVGLFIGALGCLHVANKAKIHFGVFATQLGIDPGYQAANFREIMSGNSETTTDTRAAGFVAPILFPLDLLLLICVGGVLALTSFTLAGSARVPVQIVPLLYLVPVLYMVCDLTENCLFSWLLLRPNAGAVHEGVVEFARAATIAKLYLLGLGTSQVLGLVAATGYFQLRAWWSWAG